MDSFLDDLIISFCNVKRWSISEAGGVCLAHLKRGVVRETLHTDSVPYQIAGATGLCAFNGKLVSLFQHPDHAILGNMNFNLDKERYYELSLVRRPHSICCLHGRLYVVSTGSDSVVELDEQFRQKMFWKWSDEIANTIHLNSICVSNNERLHCSAFGNAGEKGRQNERKAGFVMDLCEKSRIVENLAEPHSLTFTPSGVIFCQSALGCVSDNHGNSVDMAPHYLRGLAITAERMYVGLSVRRTASVSRSREIMQPNASTSFAAISVFSWKDYDLRTCQEIDRLEFAGISEEIYDIMLLPR